MLHVLKSKHYQKSQLKESTHYIHSLLLTIRLHYQNHTRCFPSQYIKENISLHGTVQGLTVMHELGLIDGWTVVQRSFAHNEKRFTVMGMIWIETKFWTLAVHLRNVLGSVWKQCKMYFCFAKRTLFCLLGYDGD